MNRFSRALNKRLSDYRKLPGVQYGIIGNIATGEIEVSGTDYTIYVTLMDGNTIQVYNRRTPNILKLPVAVGRDPENMPNVTQVLGAWSVYSSESDGSGLPYHHKEHEWPNADTVYVRGEQFWPSLYYPVPDLVKVYIYPNCYYIGGAWVQKTTTTTVDLTASIPGTVGKARYSLIVVDKTGAFVVRDGALVTGYDNLSDSDIPAPSDGDNVICAVRLWYGQTELRLNYDNSDFIDLRFSTLGMPVINSDNIGVLDYLTFNTSYTGTGLPAGTFQWNADRETLNLVQPNGVTLQLGQELHFYVINQTGSLIPDGSAVMFAGSLGASGILKAALAVADGTYPATYMMGIATQDIANGDTGKVTFFGEVNGFNTSGYTAGDILYLDPATPGGLTKTEPTAPNLKYQIAAAVNSKSNGTIFVRAIYSQALDELNDVNITSPVSGNVLTYNGTAWVNDVPTGGGNTNYDRIFMLMGG